ncbi:MAG: hypothetical protein KDA51_07100, partial [Planctomycetales bacterium]|nr:hypothetical protein [Planctomycetales bacterium]
MTKHLDVVDSFNLYYSYWQFLVFDSTLGNPGCVWTSGHIRQGFAKRDRTASFATLTQNGWASVTCKRGDIIDLEQYDRVIALTIVVRSD